MMKDMVEEDPILMHSNWNTEDEPTNMPSTEAETNLCSLFLFMEDFGKQEYLCNVASWQAI